MIKTTVRKHTNGRSAFTLVELLVVIGIIALLMGILLPALANSREEARYVICTTHLDQIFKASFMYASRNDDRFPHFGWASGRHPDQEWWPTQLAALMNGATEVFQCPSDPEPHQVAQVVRKPGGSLVMAEGIEPGRFSLGLTYRGSCDSVFDSGGYQLARRMIDWDDPSNALILIEASLVRDSAVTERECFRFNPDMMHVGSEEWYQEFELVHTWERHIGTSNFLFVDGGIGRHNPREVRDIASRQEYWDSSANKRFDGPKRNPGG